VQRLLTQVLLTPVVDAIVLVIVISYLLALSWQMTVVLFVLAPFTVLMFRFTSGRLQQGAMGINLSSRDLGSELEETINGISDIQVFNAQPKRNDRFREASRVAAKNTANTTAWMSLSNSGAQVLISLTTALILLSAILFGQKWGLTFASALVFMQMAPNLFTPVQRLISSYTMYQSLVPGIVSTYELFDTKPTVVEKPGAIALGEVHGDITFDNVVFGYSRAQRVLDGVSFEIKEGETIAFVGPIGCGKSTIMNLILRFLDPQQGRIMIEGKDISDVTLNSLREQVSKLSQFPFFLKDTIRENVRLGRAGASNGEIEDACKLAHIHDVIVDPQRMPRGYDTVVDVQVPSGGQKRLIALARCLLRKPEVLLLDEPTENLDADQRNRLIQVIREYANERTCLVISHDLNFVAAVADRILVIDKGRIVNQGTHEELVVREGLYKTLYGLKNVDPSLLRARGGGGGGQPAPGTPVAGMAMPGGGMPPGMGGPM
jgi:ABC-type multidrug transport system fused ATPase/permease subunit